MAEGGVLTTLVTSAGTLTFNTSGSERNYFTEVAGMDSAVIRREVGDLSQRDGGLVPPGYRSAIYPAFAGVILASDFTNRRVQADNMRAYLASLARADGTLTWTPSGTTARQRTVRLHDGPEIVQGDAIDRFQFTLVAADPLAYSITQQTSSDITVNGAAVNMTNAGNAATWPTLRLHGLVTNPIIKNNTTGKTLELDYGAGVVVADGTYIEIDTFAETVTLVGGAGGSKIGAFDPVTSEFWQLATGVNAIEVDGTSPGANAKGVVLWRDGWWG